jgi:glyoxylase I family protein
MLLRRRPSSKTTLDFSARGLLTAGKPDEFIILKLGPVRLELFPTESDNSKEHTGGEQVIGFEHLAFDVPKLEPVLEALRTENVEIGPIIDIGQHIAGCRVCFFRDPEGNNIELIEGYHDEG